MSGYAHAAYAQALQEFGQPRELPRCGGWVLERPIAGTGARDATGCYPLFACQDWGRLREDLDALAGDLVALALVADPFGDFERAELERCFDRVLPFKQHFVCDLSVPVERLASAHHRYYARKALASARVEVCADPRAFADDWARLYGMLVEKHHLRGIKAFSPRSLALQLAVPGVVALRAVVGDEVVGGHLWYVQGNVVYSHLAATSPRGYTLGVSYALYWFALEYFAQRARWLDLGAGAGLSAQGDDGLARFKRGWSSDTRMAYFCGRVLQPDRYAEIVRQLGAEETDYFPAYRRGEFA